MVPQYWGIYYGFANNRYWMRPTLLAATPMLTMLTLLLAGGSAVAALLPGGPLRVPTSPEIMIADAARSVAAARAAGQRRLIVRIVVPQLDTVRPEDLDPWPGGLAQQYPYALSLARQLLCAAVGCAPSKVRGSIVSAESVLRAAPAELVVVVVPVRTSNLPRTVPPAQRAHTLAGARLRR